MNSKPMVLVLDGLQRHGMAFGFALALTLAAVGCASQSPEIQAARALSAEGKRGEAVQLLAQGVRRNPSNTDLRMEFLRERDLAVAGWLTQAETAAQAKRYADAARLLEQVEALDPLNVRANGLRQALSTSELVDRKVARAEELLAGGAIEEAEATIRDALLAQPSNGSARRVHSRIRDARVVALDTPTLKAVASQPITLELRDTPLRNALDVIARAAQINFVFDREVRTEARVTINVKDSDVQDVLRLLLVTQQLEGKVLNENSMLIYPDTPAKQREYRDLITRMFYLVNADAKAAQAFLKNVGKLKEVHIDERLNMVAVRDTPEAIQVAERLVAAVDIADAEVMLEVEVLEVAKTRLQDLGIRFPSEIQIEARLPTAGDLPQGRIDIGRARASNLAATVLSPALRIGLESSDTDVNILANPRIRAKNHEKAKILIGEKLPVFTTTAVQNAGVSASVSYLDVGLKLEVEPNVLLDDEVGIKVLLDVTSNLERVTGPDGSTAFRLGTRTAQTALRLRDGETQVLAGLINDSERQTLSKLPGLGDIPALGRAFGNTDRSVNKTEIVLLITPRILRNLTPPQASSMSFAAGTDASTGARPLAIGSTTGKPLSISPRPVTGPTGQEGVPQDRSPAPDDGEAAMQRAKPVTLLQAPDPVSLGKDFELKVLVRDAGDVAGGEAVLQFDPTLLRCANADGNTVKVPLSASGPGMLGGSVTFRALSSGAGSTSVRMLTGTATLPAGGVRTLGAASVTIRVGL
jgi:general secretion pathway protein D